MFGAHGFDPLVLDGAPSWKSLEPNTTISVEGVDGAGLMRADPSPLGWTSAADYVGFLRRRKWLLVFTVIMTTGSAFLVSKRETKEYTAKALVVLSQQSSLPSSVIGNSGMRASDAARYDLTQAELAHTPTVAGRAIDAMSGQAAPVRGRYKMVVSGMTPAKLLASSSVSANPTSDILTFAVTARRPRDAMSLVNAYAYAFVNYRNQRDVQGAKRAAAEIGTRIRKLQREINANDAAGLPTIGLRAQLKKLVDSQTALATAITLEATDQGASGSKYAASASLTRPDTRKNVMLGAVLGVVLGMMFALLREALDTRIRSGDEISALLDQPLLARIRKPPRSLRTHDRLSMLVDPDGEHSEAYRILRVSFEFANLGPRVKTFMITSAVDSEGKSTTVANLAVALAHAGRHVILVDLDLRRPYLHNFFGLEGHAGIGDVALGNATIDQVLVPISMMDPPGGRSVDGQPAAVGILEVVTAGRTLPRSSDFLASGAVSGILHELSARGDIVLLDSPPLLAVSDASTLSSHADGIVLVVSATRARRQVLLELRRVVDRLPPVRVGCVITGEEADLGHGYGYGYGYGGYREDTGPGHNGAPAARAAGPVGDQRLTGVWTPERSPLTSPPDSPR